MDGIELNGKYINFKVAGKGKLEKILLHAIRTNSSKKIEIVNHCFKKIKIKPHKKLDNDVSFIECAMKHDYDLLCKYVPNLNISAPCYNIINLCVEYNRADLLNKYVKSKPININQVINGHTPLTLAILKRNLECLQILVDNGCRLHGNKMESLSPIDFLLNEIKMAEIENNLSDGDITFFKYAINKLLPININDNAYDKSEYDLLFDPEKIIKSKCFRNVTDLYNVSSNEFKISCIVNNLIFDNAELYSFCNLIQHDKHDFIKEFIKLRPYILLMNIVDQYIAVHAFDLGNDELRDHIVDTYSKILLKKQMGFLHFLTNQNMTKYVIKLLDKKPKRANTKNEDGRTILETALLSKKATDENLKETIDVLIKYGVDPNSENNMGTNSTHIATLFNSNEVLAHLIQYVDKDDNMDHLQIACSIGEFDKVKTLSNSGFKIIRDESEIPLCIYAALNINSYDIVNYILSEPKFGIEKKNYSHLLSLAKDNQSHNKILRLFDESIEQNDNEDVDDDILKLHGTFLNFSKHYCDNEMELICVTKTILLMFLKIIYANGRSVLSYGFFSSELKYITKNGKMRNRACVSELLNVIIIHQKIKNIYAIELMHIYEDVINEQECESLVHAHRNSLAKNREKLEHLSELLERLFKFVVDVSDKKYEEYIKGFKHNFENDDVTITDSSEEPPDDENNIAIDDDKISDNNGHAINSGSNEINQIVEVITTSNIEYPKITMNLAKQMISSLLSRLTYPFTTNNYGILSKKLSEDVVISDEGNKYKIFENDIPVAVVYKNNKHNIPCWIKHYGYNVCNKDDDNHMFPFAIDILIHWLWEKGDNTLKCGYGKSKTSTCLYFYGKYFLNERWTRGYFEYFLNDKNILFHRLFKPLKMSFIVD